MAVERTLSIVKPDAVAKNIIGEIYSRFEKNGLQIVAAKMLRCSGDYAGGFYAEHMSGERYWHSASDLDRTCGGLGTLNCYCGGDNCVCGNFGEAPCYGCADCGHQDEDYA